jgi:hypothetical protein
LFLGDATFVREEEAEPFEYPRFEALRLCCSFPSRPFCVGWDGGGVWIGELLTVFAEDSTELDPDAIDSGRICGLRKVIQKSKDLSEFDNSGNRGYQETKKLKPTQRELVSKMESSEMKLKANRCIDCSEPVTECRWRRVTVISQK